MDIDTAEKIILGRITGVYGVKGWVKIFSYTDPMESIVDFSPWYIRAENKKNSPWTRVKLKAGKRHAKTVVAKLEHCNDRDQAMAYIGTEISIEPQQLEALKGKDEYYWRDLLGLRVINQQHIELGVVKSLLETGANDVLVVAAEAKVPNKAEGSEVDGSAAEGHETEDRAVVETKEHLIPWVMGSAIIAVDLKQGIIEVDWDADF